MRLLFKGILFLFTFYFALGYFPNIFGGGEIVPVQAMESTKTGVRAFSEKMLLASNQDSGGSAVELKTIDPQGLCPQVRGTEPAPEPFAGMTNPLMATQENIEAGSKLFHRDAKPIPCETCHGFKGNGFGVIFQQMKPYPRDFTCFHSKKDVSDGQLFWIISHGSHGTRMRAFKDLQDKQIWQLILYIRRIAG